MCGKEQVDKPLKNLNLSRKGVFPTYFLITLNTFITIYDTSNKLSIIATLKHKNQQMQKHVKHLKKKPIHV